MWADLGLYHGAYDNNVCIDINQCSKCDCEGICLLGSRPNATLLQNEVVDDLNFSSSLSTAITSSCLHLAQQANFVLWGRGGGARLATERTPPSPRGQQLRRVGTWKTCASLPCCYCCWCHYYYYNNKNNQDIISLQLTL